MFHIQNMWCLIKDILMLSATCTKKDLDEHVFKLGDDSIMS